ncbi:MAG: ComF family protein [Ruminococcaceae bacterium]|nr:ComF family protein [Oscillospiraceae bacterium]
MIRWILRLLFPPKCVFCRAVTENENFAVCQSCLLQIPHNRRACKICGAPLDTVYGDMVCVHCRKHRRAFTKAYVPFLYKDTVRTAILQFKFGGRKASAVTFASFILMKMRELEADRPDLITFVPMHFIRLGSRGYNQAALLAQALGEKLNVPVCATLRKTKNTMPQSRRRGRDRRQSLGDAFALRRNTDIQGKRILLLDDVITTGTTLNRCASVLKKAGADEIQIATVAATPYSHR